MYNRRRIKNLILYLPFLLLPFDGTARATPAPRLPPLFNDSIQVSTPGEALAYISGIPRLAPSIHWPNVDPDLFLQNLKSYIEYPLRIYEGRTTNFCAFAVITYLPLRYDPLGYIKFMLQLYKEGKAGLGHVFFEPGETIRKTAGLLKFKGMLDVTPASQVWFLCLADHFKGYLNILNRKFDPGDENRLWAATNYSKFNRMLRELFPLRVEARGSDIIRPKIDDLYTYLKDKLRTGTVFLYLNNRLLYNNKHGIASRLGIPTHFVVLFDISLVNDKLNITYWDYGCMTLQQISREFLHKITFGVTLCSIPR